ncbi:MAG: GHKL domain-containing protein [Oscillospiraceae bacterium]|nr:GHKL domain-containing protein [Oscillospiraceae bacterium]
MILITFNYDSNTIKRLVSVGFIILLSQVLSTTSVFMIQLIPNLTMDWIAYNLVNIISLSVLLFLTSLLLNKLNKKSKNTDEISAIWVPALVITGITLLLGILTFIELPNIQMFWTISVLYGGLFLVFFISNTLMVVFGERVKSELHSQEKDYYMSQCLLMQESIEKMKSYRHDIRLHLAALKDYTKDNKAATDYLNSLIGDISKSDIYSDTGNIAFDSIINYKLRNAKDDDIRLDVSVIIPPELNIEVSDVVTILGNLLDNALEAVTKASQKLIKLDITYSKGTLDIRIDNTFDGVIKYAEGSDVEADKKHLITQKDSGESGFGYKNIRNSMEKYNGYLKITHEDNIFSVGILLYVDDSGV